MAGIKITDLPALSVADSADYLCIVDVSDTSASPAGTTKKIEVANAGISGSWTPTTDNLLDAVTNGTITDANYSRVGNIVTCSISGLVEVDFSVDTSGSFDFDLPTASVFCIGTANIQFPNQCNGIIKTVGANARVLLSSNDTTLVANGIPYNAIFQYAIS
jgi:hypothetical protein